MPRSSKSQWDFGELFPREETRRVLSVSELTIQVKRLVEQHLGTVWVTGEITNLREQSSGHIYFTLKDATSQLACVLFRGERVADRRLLEDGQKVILQGEVTVYEARGQYQLIVRKVELRGVGALQAAFERLKRKLAAEGLFAEERKRPLPVYPQCIGIVTSPTGAALRDVLHVMRRRNPAVQLILVPSRVQGEGAAQEVAEAIRLLNDFATSEPASLLEDGGRDIDAILLTRGGGSLEDLWAFNEEVVARAIAASAIPVVSAVGHEIDFTISDFVADLRAATPSAAAEILTEGVFTAASRVREAPARMTGALRGFVLEAKDDLDSVQGRLGRAHPRRRLNESAQRVDELHLSVSRSIRSGVRRAELTWTHAAGRLQRCRPQAAVDAAREELSRGWLRLSELVQGAHRLLTDRLQTLQTRLRLLGPEQVLARGYSITMDAATGRVLLDAADAAGGQVLRTRLHKGSIKSRVANDGVGPGKRADNSRGVSPKH